MVAVLYDAGLSTAISFDPSSTVDADAFVRERLMPPFAAEVDGDADPLVVIATDGELYGHHQPFREQFLARLVGRTAPAARPYATPALADAIRAAESRVSRRSRCASGHRGVATTGWLAGWPTVRASPTVRGRHRCVPLRAPCRWHRHGDGRSRCLATGTPDPGKPATPTSTSSSAPRRPRPSPQRSSGHGRSASGRLLIDLMDAQRWRLRCSPAAPGSGRSPTGSRRPARCVRRSGPRG
jgi:hypothetical protein